MKYNLNQSYHSMYADEDKHTILQYVIYGLIALIGIYAYSLVMTFIIGKLFYGMF